MAGEGSRKTQFQPGQSGNPQGRPPGARSRKLAVLDDLGEQSAEAILVATIDGAKSGDTSAARAILDRVWPTRKGARVVFDLPEMARAGDLAGAVAGVNRQVAAGLLSLEEGALVVTLLDAQRKALETSELVARIAVLEERIGLK